VFVTDIAGVGYAGVAENIRVEPLRFQMPHYPCSFEISDEWLVEAGIAGFVPATPSYFSTPRATLVPLTEVEPVARLLSCRKDLDGFDRDRLIKLLKRFVASEVVDPVPMVRLPVLEFPSSPYRYRICDGFHRFYGSVAAGFQSLPATVF